MADTKPKFRDELDKYSRAHFGESIAKLNEKQRSDALTLCYLTKVRNELLPGSVPDEFEEAHDFLTDAQNDRTVDFIFRDNNHVTIVQAKHRGSDKNEQEAEFDSFRNCLRKLCPDTRTNTAINQKLLDLIADIEWDTDNFTLLFLSLARHSDRIAQAAENDLDDIKDPALKDISSRSEIRYLSEDEINKEWRDVVSRIAGGSPTVSILISSPKTEDELSSPYLQYSSEAGIVSYLTVLSAPQIHELYTRHRDKLFNLNIRNYIGDTRTNKKIIETTTQEGDQFFFYNNGISAVSTSVVPTKKGGETWLSCENFSIINGAQTFRSISKAHTRKAAVDSTRKLRVLLRISEFDFRRSAGGDALDKITRYNNTQNSMQASDFRSNDDVQLSLVKYVDDVSAFGGKKFLYRNKRTQGSERNKISIKMDDFCRSVFAYQFGPADFFGGLTYLYGTAADGGYVKLFGEDLGALSQSEFDRLFGIWLLTSHVDGELRDEKKKFADTANSEELVRKHALERKYLVFFALAEVLKEVCRIREIDEAHFLRGFSKPRWQEDEGRVKFVDKAFYLACDMVVQAYQIAEAKPGFVHRNFFRENETLLSISNTKASRRSQLKELASIS